MTGDEEWDRLVECYGGLEREELAIETRLVLLARAPD